MTKQLILTSTAFLALAVGSASAVTMSSVIVTAEASKSAPAPLITQQDVVAQVSKHPAEVATWHLLRDDPAGLELWIMIDDGTNSNVGIQFNDIKAFIRQQPREVKVAVGYLRNGSVMVAQAPSTDREAAVKAVRLPIAMPGISASPYIAVADFLHKLPAVPFQPREIVLISSGIDPYYGPGPQNPYLESAFNDAQKAGVPIYTIYYSSAGRSGRAFRQVNWGQNDLSELSEATGGKFFWQGNMNPVSLQPYFDEINRRYAGQYVMRLDVANVHHGFERLQLHTESSNVKLVGPLQVYVQ